MASFMICIAWGLVFTQVDDAQDGIHVSQRFGFSASLPEEPEKKSALAALGFAAVSLGAREVWTVQPTEKRRYGVLVFISSRSLVEVDKGTAVGKEEEEARQWAKLLGMMAGTFGGGDLLDATKPKNKLIEKPTRTYWDNKPSIQFIYHNTDPDGDSYTRGQYFITNKAVCVLAVSSPDLEIVRSEQVSAIFSAFKPYDK